MGEIQKIRPQCYLERNARVIFKLNYYYFDFNTLTETAYYQKHKNVATEQVEIHISKSRLKVGMYLGKSFWEEMFQKAKKIPDRNKPTYIFKRLS